MKTALFAIIAATLSSAAFATPVTYIGPSAGNIDTGYQQSFDFSVADSGTIGSVSVYIATGGPYGDDVSFWLSHLGTTVKLYTGHGDNGSSVINATFSDAATNGAPYNGSATGFLLPVEALSAFNGLDLFGTWSILTQDFVVPGDNTSLAASSLTVDAVPEPAMLGLFGLGAAGLVASRRRKAA